MQDPSATAGDGHLFFFGKRHTNGMDIKGVFTGKNTRGVFMAKKFKDGFSNLPLVPKKTQIVSAITFTHD
jgi:hypothetical protein